MRCETSRSPRWKPASAPRPRERATTIFLLIALVAVWLAAHPYRGIYHDARLYALQALQALDSAPYAGELFFEFGSQDSFTLFSRAYAWLIEATDLEVATRLLVAAGQLLWLAALYFVARALVEGWQKWLFLFLAASWPTGYGDFTFHYAETFLSARLLAEVFVLGGLAALLTRRWSLAAGAAAAAACIHPLVGLSGLLVAGCYLSLVDRRWLLAVPLAAAGTLLLGWVGLAPFDGLWQRMDAEWFELAFMRNRAVFVTQWEADQILPVFWVLGILALAAAACRGRLRRLLAGTAIAAAVGFGLNLLGSDLLANVFIVQVQPFRVLWLAQLFSCLAVAVLVLHREIPVLTRAWVAASALAAPTGGLVLLAGAIVLRQRTILKAVPERLRRLLWLPLPFALGFWGVSWAAEMQLSIAARKAQATLGTPFGGYLLQALTPALVLGAAGLLGAFAWIARPHAMRATAMVLVALLALASIVVWDQRDPVQRQLESTYAGAAGPLPALRRGGSVYWDDFHVNEIWLAARRPIYVSWLQGAGLLFSRGTAIEWKRRIERVSGRPFFDADGRRDGEGLPSIGADRLAVLCRDRALDYVVLRSAVESSARHFSMLGLDFYVHDCRQAPARLALN